MAELTEIVAFISQYKGEFEDSVIRERLKSDGATPEQIEEAYKTVALREEMETDSMSGAVKVVIAVLVLGAMGIFAAMRLAPGMSSDDSVPKLSMQAGEVSLPAKR